MVEKPKRPRPKFKFNSCEIEAGGILISNIDDNKYRIDLFNNIPVLHRYFKVYEEEYISFRTQNTHKRL